MHDLPSLGEAAQFIMACVLAFNCWQTWDTGRRAKIIKADVAEIKHQTNGINAQLLKVTGDAKYAEGVKHGEEYIKRDPA